MRLENISRDIIMDEFDVDCNPNQMVFISSMLGIECLTVPNKFSGKIYTSRLIFKFMRSFNNHQHVKLSTNCVVLRENVPCNIEGADLQVIMFVSDDINQNVMFMFQIADGTTHLYAGVCTEFRSLIFNEMFMNILHKGVENLFVDVSRANVDSNQLKCVPKVIENLCNAHPDYQIVVCIPTFGYESFVYALALHLRKLVAVGGHLSAEFTCLRKQQHFANNSKVAKVLITHRSCTMDEIKISHEQGNLIFIKISEKCESDNADMCVIDKNGFVEIGWSPLPSDFNLYMLTNLVKPNRIHAICHESFVMQQLVPQVPDFLRVLCNNYLQITEEKQSEINALEETYSTLSSASTVVNMQSEINALEESYSTLSMSSTVVNMQLTQEKKIANNMSAVRVREWLTSNKSNENKSLKNTTLKAAPVVANVSKSATKSPTESKNQSYAETFCIRKGRLDYIDDSDSN